MTEVSFHFNVADRLAYSCRLLRKATRLGSRVAVSAPGETLGQLDKALWTFDPVDFVAHRRLAAGEAVPERLRPTPIWLLDQLGDAPEHDVLLNLGETVPTGFESFSRVIEVVTLDDADRSQARERWKHYSGRGYTITRHEVNA
jgi:DNA polymerase III subunit chi